MNGTATTDGLLDEVRRIASERDEARSEALAARQELALLADELWARTAERDALAARLEAAPAMREVIGELRRIKELLYSHNEVDPMFARRQLSELIRRIDLES